MRKSTHLYKKFNCAYFLIVCVAIQLINLNAATIIVTSEDDDSGSGTLRNAITNASDGDTIVFAPNVNLISLLSPLPIITQEELTIDGLAQVFASEVIPGECKNFPSPVNEQELFSAALRITIDGSLIPKEALRHGIGLQIESNNVTIIGLRVQNFNGRITNDSNDLNAIGILSLSRLRELPTIKCCEILNIIGGQSQVNFDFQGEACGIQNALLVDKILIKNIKSLSSFDLNKTNVGESNGIKNAKTITNCAINTIERGSISSSKLEFVKAVSGINVDNDVSFSLVTIQNCTIQNICGGSIESTNTEESLIDIDMVSGISLNSSFINSCAIDNVTICTVNAGTININGSNTTVSIDPIVGIYKPSTSNLIQSSQKTPYKIITSQVLLSNNCVSCVAGYTINTLGNDNTVLYSQVIALDASNLTVSSSTTSTTIQNNRIDAIYGNTITSSGQCNQTLLRDITFTALKPCTLQVPFSVIGIHVLNANENQKNLIFDNSIKNIGKSQFAVNGNASYTLSAGSAAINVQDSPDNRILKDARNLITGNTIEAIAGPTYTLQPDSLYAIQLTGTAGIHVESLITRVSNNSIKNIHEGSMISASDTPFTFYGLLDINPTPISFLENTQFLPAYTSGITVIGSTEDTGEFKMNNIIIKNNTVEAIKGSLVTGGTAALGSYATGIIVQPSQKTNEIPTFKQLSQCSSTIRLVSNNIIKNVHAHSKAASYGIYIDGSNLLIESAIVDQDTPLVNSIMTIQENTINSVTGVGTVTPITINSTQLYSPLCGSTLEPKEILLIPLLPSPPTSGIFTLFGGCSSLYNNNIFDIHAPLTRGITTIASSDMNISGNTIFKTDGPGIFIGGAAADPLLINKSIYFNQNDFENFFPSVRNTIYSNSTYENTGKGIELGLVNWNNFFTSIPLLPCTNNKITTSKSTAKGGPIEIEIIGNHNQPSPYITRVVCNRNGTITIEVKFSDPNHSNSQFIVQFFRNSTNDIPHGEQLISNFENSLFTITTDTNGRARKTFTFVPAYQVEPSDIISAHVTLTIDGTSGSIEEPNDIGDTSEFRMEKTTNNNPAGHLQKHYADRQFCYGL